MNFNTNQAVAIAAVRLLREAGEETIAHRLIEELVQSDLFVDEPLVPTLRAMTA